MRVVIIGAGAAGCFCAVNLKRLSPDTEVVVLEKGQKELAKVAITGGGRCNLTNSFHMVRSIESVYPRGHKLMKRLLKVFSHEDTMQWFENEGVRLTIQEDECVFPVSQDAMEIVNTLRSLMRRQGIKVVLNHKVESVTPLENGYLVDDVEADVLVVTTGGSPKASGQSFLEKLLLEMIAPVPSLFTFCVDDKALHDLMGTVVETVCTRISGTKFQAEGPLLITHWGLSGPAVLKLSSQAARHLADSDYHGEIAVNWFGEDKEPSVLAVLQELQQSGLQRQLSNHHPVQFTQKHWLYIINKVGLQPTKRWQEVGPKQLNRLASLLTNDTYPISGRGQFKEEFVTAGGVALSNLDHRTLECRNHKNLYFAGEATDVDAVTGGFNLQAAWTMGFVVAKSIIDKGEC